MTQYQELINDLCYFNDYVEDRTNEFDQFGKKYFLNDSMITPAIFRLH